MKVIIKIDDYIPERNSVVFKTCRLNSHKPIDEYEDIVVDCHDLNMTDCETFIESLINKVSNDRIESQDESEGILDSNIPVEITGELDFQRLIGVVVQGRLSNKINRRLKMRRIEL